MKKTNAEITPPSAEEVPVLTDRLVEIRKEIEQLTAEEKIIKARLELYALGQQQEPLKDEKREGRKVSLQGTRHRATVVFSSDAIIQSFKEGTVKKAELLRVLGFAAEDSTRSPEELLKLFFDPPDTWTNKFKDGQRFREAAAEWLPAEVAPKFIAACRQTDKHGIPKSRTSFEVEGGAGNGGEGGES